MLGLFVLGGFTLWRRRRRGQEPRFLGVLPDGFSATVATSLYGVAAAVLALQSLGAFPAGGEGTGQWLNGAIVALAMAVVYGTSLYRTVLTRLPVNAPGSPSQTCRRPPG